MEPSAGASEGAICGAGGKAPCRFASAAYHPRPLMNARLRWLSLFPLLLALALPAAAQAKLTVEATLQPASGKPGDEVLLVLKAKTPAGFHAYGTKEETNIPVALKAKNLQLDGFELVGTAVVPQGSLKTKLGVETHPLPDEFEVTQKLKVKDGFAGAQATIAGALDYQLCDANMCLAPAKAKFEVTLTNTAAKAGTQEPGKAQAAAPKFVDADQRLQIVPRIEPSPVRAGESITLVLDVTVLDATRHAYGAKEETNMPIALDAAKLQLRGLQADGEAVVPPGDPVEKFGLVTHPLPHEFQVKQRLRVPAGQAPGTVKVEGVLDYQMCTENFCDPAGELAFSVDVAVEKHGALTDGGETEVREPSKPKDEGSLWFLIVTCFFGGLLALVMPCTYPMIPITFSFFTKQADARGGKVLPLALAYGGGIVGMFALIGVLAASLGSIGGGVQVFAAHWITNSIIGVAFLVFAFSLLGLFTLQPPRFLTDLAGKSRSVGGLGGVLLMGATLVVTSFTCTAPVVGGLLGATVKGGGTHIILGMTVFGLTMAAPFVALALLPGKVKTLPKSGDWMNVLKVSLGWIELAAALKFLSNAEIALGLHWMPREVFFGIWALIFVVLAAYLVGFRPRAQAGPGRLASGVIAALLAGYFGSYVGGREATGEVMTALAPNYGFDEIPQEDGVERVKALHAVVVDDYEAAVAKAKNEGKLLLVNFTGFNCSNCRAVEKGIMPQKTIAPILTEHFVEARLHLDVEGRVKPENWKRHLQLRQDLVEGRTTTPTYVSVDPNIGKPIVEHVLGGDWLTGYQQFLAETLRRTGRKASESKSAR